MVCSKCGAQLADQAAYCSQCGTARPASARQPSPETDARAVTSFVLGLISIVLLLNIFAGVPAIILGHMSRSSIRRSNGRLRGSGLALTGLILGYLSLALLPTAIVVYRTVPKVFSVRILGNQTRTLNTIHSINTATAAFQLENNVYPESLEALSGESLVPLDPGLVASGVQDGYRYTYKPNAAKSSYTLHADPVSLAHGQFHFYSDSTGVIRVERDRPADAHSQIIQSAP